MRSPRKRQSSPADWQRVETTWWSLTTRTRSRSFPFSPRPGSVRVSACRSLVIQVPAQLRASVSRRNLCRPLKMGPVSQFLTLIILWRAAGTFWRAGTRGFRSLNTTLWKRKLAVSAAKSSVSINLGVFPTGSRAISSQDIQTPKITSLPCRNGWHTR